MSNKNSIKVLCQECGNSVICKLDVLNIDNYEDLKNKIIEKAQAMKKGITIGKKDKFILEIKECKLDIESIWDSDTYNYFLNKIRDNFPDKIKFNLKKVDKFPTWNPPQYLNILKNSLKSAWNSIKKEIKEDLTEKYLDDGKRLYLQEKKENSSNLNDEYFTGIHSNVVCNNCLTCNFSGARYICAECNNFNLCEYCQKNACISHKPEHTFIKLNTPILEDVQKYNSIFFPNKALLTKKEEQPFEISIDIINNGEKNLQGCFISPIRFGRKYLGCLKTTILEDCKKGKKISLNVLIKFEDEEDEEDSLNSYEGCFRLMTKNGIPFGDIYNIKVLIEE